ncbi:MAG: roadblock/LC7 domain-containing protein [Myxococcaceae bacterium]
MSFQTELQNVVSQVDGAVACSVMGFDGITVETVQANEQTSGELELSTTWVEFANILTQLKNAAQVLKTGGVNEVSIHAENVVTLMRLVSPEYFLVLALKPDGNFGRGRFALRVAAPKVKAEL